MNVNSAVSADYDTGGNLTEFGDYEYEYDPLNRLRRVTHGVWRIVYPEDGDPTDIWEVDGTMDSWYDANGERVGTCDRLNRVFTMYLRDEMGNVLSEYRANACPASPTITSGPGPVFDWRQDYYYFDRKLAASESLDLGYPSVDCEPNGSASDIYFYHSDHLGSPRVVSRLTNPTPGDEFGFVKSFHVYWPYGEEITTQVQDQFTHRYTGHERDFATNLDYMHARYYSPFLGRFLSTDLLNGRTVNPQSFNLYGYSLNNPVNYVDPYGLDEEEDDEDIPWGGGTVIVVRPDGLSGTDEHAFQYFLNHPYAKWFADTMSLGLELYPVPTPVHEVMFAPATSYAQDLTGVLQNHKAEGSAIHSLAWLDYLIKTTKYARLSTLAVADAKVTAAAAGTELGFSEGFLASGIATGPALLMTVGALGGGGVIGYTLYKYVIPASVNQAIGDAMLWSIESTGIYHPCERDLNNGK